MAVELPVRQISYPSVLTGHENGKLPDAILWSTPGLAGGPTVRLVPPAARSWRAWTAAALVAGHVLKATSAADSYRTEAQQLAIWLDRYEPDPFPGYIDTRWWPAHYDSQGRWVVAHLWYQRPNTAAAAPPGHSNHGLGLAVDTGEERDGDRGAESLDSATLAWMISTAHLYGWSWETQSEPWHVRYVAGDAIPAAVLVYEGGDVSWTDLLPDPTKRQPGPGKASDLLWMAAWHGADALAAAQAVQAAVTAGFAADATRDAAQLAAIKALATAGGVDAAPIVAAIEAVRDEARAEYGRLHAELAELRAENIDLRARLTAAARAEADALDSTEG